MALEREGDCRMELVRVATCRVPPGSGGAASGRAAAALPEDLAPAGGEGAARAFYGDYLQLP